MKKALVLTVALSFIAPPLLAGGSGHHNGRTGFVGAVYAMTNDFENNQLVGYGRNADGTLERVGRFDTGGQGAAFDGGEGLDPLISAYSLIPARNGRFLLAVNAGSNTLSALRINRDLSLTLTDTVSTGGIGPNSIAFRRGLVFVTNIDADGEFNGEPDQEGNVRGFYLTPRGKLIRNPLSAAELGNRPSAVRFSPDGRFLLISSINAGSSALASGSADELVVYRVNRFGVLSEAPVGSAASTLPGNAEGRNLPSAIGFEVVREGGDQFVVVTEAREFQPDGTPPTLPNLQTGSVSTWKLERDGSLTPIVQDSLSGISPTDGERTACWIDFSADGDYFWSVNALDASISSYSFDGGEIELIEEVAVSGAPPTDDDPFGTTDGWVDVWTSRDGRYLYQLFGLAGAIGVFEIDGPDLRPVQEVRGDLPLQNTQGIVAF